MNHLVKILILVLVGCASKKVESKKDLSIQEITIKEEKRKSTIEVNINSLEGITFMDMFYKNNKAKIKVDKENKTLTSHFKQRIPRDINLSSDPREEYGNMPPVIEKTPEMKKNELIISYKKNDDKILFYKIDYRKFLDEKSK